MKLLRTWLILVGLLLIAAFPAWGRKWTSKDGKFSVEAELVEAKDGNVRLKRQDGKIITVPVSKLSKADRDFLASIVKARKKPEVTKATPSRVVALLKLLGWKVKVDQNKAVVRVSFTGPRLTDNALMQLKELIALRSLDLSHAKVTDDTMKHLRELTWLQSLDIGDATITDAGLEQLKALTKINRLYLNNTDVTDAGLEHLKAMKDLRILDLYMSRVTDAGLEHLKGLNNLTNLELRGTKITFEGVKKLRQALPKCIITYK